MFKRYSDTFNVVPHAGTWIEISDPLPLPASSMSFPTRERGLKLILQELAFINETVVPHAGTWIEMQERYEELIALESRSPRGNVD